MDVDAVVDALTRQRSRASRIAHLLPLARAINATSATSVGRSATGNAFNTGVIGCFVRPRGVLAPPQLLVVDREVAEGDLGLPRGAINQMGWFLCPTNAELRQHPYWVAEFESGDATAAPSENHERADPHRQRELLRRLRMPFAMCYWGRQFGVMSGQLGDGRLVTLCEAYRHRGPLLLGSTTASSGCARLVDGASSRAPIGDDDDDDGDCELQKCVVQVKGAGVRTPYSRGLDGLLTLRSALKEWALARTLARLGIPRADVAAVYRERGRECFRDAGGGASAHSQACGVLVRVTQCPLRVGTFDFLMQTQQWELMGRLVESYMLRVPFRACRRFTTTTTNHDSGVGGPSAGESSLLDLEATCVALLREVGRRAGSLVAQWQAFGFVHGVLNTDNIALCGETIDIATGCFIHRFDDSYCQNSDDVTKMYAFGRQPQKYFEGCERFAFIIFSWLRWRRCSSSSSSSDSRSCDDDTAARRLSAELLSAVSDGFQRAFASTLDAALCARVGVDAAVVGGDGDTASDDASRALREVAAATLTLLQACKPAIDAFFDGASRDAAAVLSSSLSRPQPQRRVRSAAASSDGGDGECSTDDDRDGAEAAAHNRCESEAAAWRATIVKHRERLVAVTPTVRALPSFGDLAAALLVAGGSDDDDEGRDTLAALRDAYDSAFPSGKENTVEGCGCG